MEAVGQGPGVLGGDRAVEEDAPLATRVPEAAMQHARIEDRDVSRLQTGLDGLAGRNVGLLVLSSNVPQRMVRVRLREEQRVPHVVVDVL